MPLAYKATIWPYGSKYAIIVENKNEEVMNAESFLSVQMTVEWLFEHYPEVLEIKNHYASLYSEIDDLLNLKYHRYKNSILSHKISIKNDFLNEDTKEISLTDL
jgi:hypothetical protein